MVQEVSHRPLTAEARFGPGSVHVGFVSTKWHWDRFFSVVRFSPVNTVALRARISPRE
jgi:hypothetical protein